MEARRVRVSCSLDLSHFRLILSPWVQGSERRRKLGGRSAFPPACQHQGQAGKEGRETEVRPLGLIPTRPGAPVSWPRGAGFPLSTGTGRIGHTWIPMAWGSQPELAKDWGVAERASTQSYLPAV